MDGGLGRLGVGDIRDLGHLFSGTLCLEHWDVGDIGSLGLQGLGTLGVWDIRAKQHQGLGTLSVEDTEEQAQGRLGTWLMGISGSLGCQGLKMLF